MKGLKGARGKVDSQSSFLDMGEGGRMSERERMEARRRGKKLEQVSILH